MSKRHNRIKNLPVYKVAQEMYELANAITEAIKEDEKKEHLVSEIIGNAMLVQVKIAGAAGSTLYSLKMQNAVVIKIAVQDMLNAVIVTEMFDMNEGDYVQLMRDKVEEFRLAFIDWIRGFDKSNDLPDNWAIRFDTSTPEQEKLEELMFDEDRFFEELDNNHLDWGEDDEDEHGPDDPKPL